jgi:hypothetical protein
VRRDLVITVRDFDKYSYEWGTKVVTVVGFYRHSELPIQRNELANRQRFRELLGEPKRSESVTP